MKINDCSALVGAFEELNKRLEKVQKQQPGLVPRSYLRALAELDDYLTNAHADKELRKKMSPTNAKALNTMRQRLKKHLPAYEELVKKFRENPEETEEDEESESESGSDEDDEDEEGEEDDEDFQRVRLGIQQIICA
jgi:translation initiation factor 3 subunit C